MRKHNNLSPRINEAMQVATHAHREQRRKLTNDPYILHPLAVMDIAADVTTDEDTLIACLFHDVLEDVEEEFDREAMANAFGQRVVDIVSGVTKDSSISDWHERSLSYLQHLEEAPIESVIVSAADKIHNLQSLLVDHTVYGDELWDHFRTGKDGQLWWHTEILRVLEDRIPDSPLTKQLAELVDRATRLTTDT